MHCYYRWGLQASDQIRSDRLMWLFSLHKSPQSVLIAKHFESSVKESPHRMGEYLDREGMGADD